MNASPIIKPTKDLVIAVKERTDNLPDDPADNSEILAAIASIGGFTMLDHSYTDNMFAGGGINKQISPGGAEAWLITYFAYCDTGTAGSWLRLELCIGSAYREIDYDIDSDVRVSSKAVIALHGTTMRLRLTGLNNSGSTKVVYSRISGVKLT